MNRFEDQSDARLSLRFEDKFDFAIEGKINYKKQSSKTIMTSSVHYPCDKEPGSDGKCPWGCQPAGVYQDRYCDVQAEMGLCCDHEELMGEIKRLVKKDDEILSLKKEIEAHKMKISNLFREGWAAAEWEKRREAKPMSSDEEEEEEATILRGPEVQELVREIAEGGWGTAEEKINALFDNPSQSPGVKKLRKIEKEMEEEGLLELKG